MEGPDQEGVNMASDENTGPFSCFSRAKINTRRKGHITNTVNVCNICGAKLKNRSSLMQHKKNIHFAIPILRCDICGAKKVDEEALKKHMIAVHKIHVGIVCDLCGFTLDDRNSFERHMASVHNTNPNTIPMVHGFNEVFCEHCGAQLANQESLQQHKRTFHTVPMVGPPRGMFPTGFRPGFMPGALSRKRVHPMNSALLCDICGSLLPDPQTLEVHKRTVHSAPKVNSSGGHAPEAVRTNTPAPPCPNNLPSGINPPLPPDIACLVSSTPSQTMLVGELPTGCLVRDLTALFNRYGLVESIRLVCSGRAALVKFADVASPSRLVNMAKTNPFFVGTTHVCLEYASTSAVDRFSAVGSRVQDKNPPSKIIHFDISAVFYPVTVDVIKAICAPHGTVDRIFIGKKNLDCSLEALVEFRSVDEASLAKGQLDGADIYSGCCSLSVTFSRLQRVRVINNDTESWDFTTQASGADTSNQTHSVNQLVLPASSGLGTSSSAPPIPSRFPPTVGPFSSVAPLVPPPQVPFCPAPGAARFSRPPPAFGNFLQASPTVGSLPAACLPPTGMLAYPPPSQPGRPQAVPTGTTPAASQPFTSPPPMLVATSAGETLSAALTGSSQLKPIGSEVAPGSTAAGTTSTGTCQAGKPSETALFDCMQGVVLMVNNFPTHLNCDHLFNLLCLYGNIARIKFLKSRPGCALIQLGSAEASDLVHRYYDGVSVFGQTLRFFHSKQSELQEQVSVETLDDGSPVMKTYINDSINRFRNSATKSRILGPSRTLHFFNAPLNITPEEICCVFTDCGAKVPPRVLIFATKSSQNTSFGVVEWDTLSDALEALILANHHLVNIPGSANPLQFKLAFSTKSVSEGHSGVSMIRYPAPPSGSVLPQSSPILSNGIPASVQEALPEPK